MNQHVPTIEYQPSSATESVRYQLDIAQQNPFDLWNGTYQSYNLNDQMEWLSGNVGQYPVSSQTGPATLHHSMSDPTVPTIQSQVSTPRHRSQVDLQRTPSYPSELYSSFVPQTSATQTAGELMPIDSSSVDRPPSMSIHSSNRHHTNNQGAGTMLDSASSVNSRPSSSSSSPLSRGPKFKVPAIRTQFGNHGHAPSLNNTPFDNGFQIAPDPDCMSAMSNEWMHMQDSSDQHSIHERSLSATSLKTTPALLEPFQWQSPVTRRTSVSSAVSGPVFSPYGTPLSAVWQQSALSSPYSQLPQQTWTPASSSSRFSPVSPNQQRGYGTWSRSQYLNALRQSRPAKPAMSLPSRNKPRLVRNVTDTYSMMQGQSSAQPKPRPVDSRARASGGSHSQPSSATSHQLPLPEFQSGALFTTPDMLQTEFHSVAGTVTPTRDVLPSSATHTPMPILQSTPRAAMTPNFNSLHLSTPYTCHQPYPILPTNVPSTPTNTNSLPTPAHQPPLPVPSEPPLADFVTDSANVGDSCSEHGHSHPSASGPIRQSPHFEGDIYTPRYKRRNAAGKWEGWCGYCQPGRWLDLKNSRFWEDKLRNHGICARTKTFFEGPVRVRWVSDRGTIWEGDAGDSGFDLSGKEGIEDDGIGRKREGLCKECNTWVNMDGTRSRGKGRCVAWWMHAYKCHEQSKSRPNGTGNI